MRSCVRTRRHCEEQSDEAIQLAICGAKVGLLRYARKDVDGAHLPTRYSVIARSSCDEAIQLCFRKMDCFASLAMTWRGTCQHDTPSLRGAKRRSNPSFLSCDEMDCFARLATTRRELTPPRAAVGLRRGRRERVSSLRCLLVIARSSCDEAIHAFLPRRYGIFASLAMSASMLLRVASGTCGSTLLIPPGLLSRYGCSTRPRTSCSSEPCHFSVLRRLWASASAPSRPSNFSRSALLALRKVCTAIDCRMASVFLTRGLSSSINKLCSVSPRPIVAAIP